jgi:hypothetical protein
VIGKQFNIIDIIHNNDSISEATERKNPIIDEQQIILRSNESRVEAQDTSGTTSPPQTKRTPQFFMEEQTKQHRSKNHK